MKSVFGILAALVLLATTAVVSAEPAKVGVVDLQRAMNQSEHGKNVKIELEAIVKEKSQELEKLAAERDALQKDLEKNRLVMSEDAVREKIGRINEIESRAKERVKKSNDELSKLQRDKEYKILKDLDKIISDIGKDGGYTLILPAEMVLYVPAGASITNEVIKRYNAFKGLTPSKK